MNSHQIIGVRIKAADGIRHFRNGNGITPLDFALSHTHVVDGKVVT